MLFPENANDTIRAEQVRLLYQQGMTVQILGVLTALVSVSVFWKVADHSSLLLWLGILVAVSFVRLATGTGFARIGDRDFPVGKWANLYIAGTFVSGVVWGILAFFYDPAWPAPYQVILFVIYTGLIAGSFNTNSSVFLAFPAFYLPPVVCLMYVMLQQRNGGFTELTILILIYTVLMYDSSLKYHRRLTETLKLRFENEKLADRLTHSNEKLLRLAEVDALTEVCNRRSMDGFLKKMWHEHYQQGEPLALLFIDIDFFKEFNDTYGHGEGDRSLVRVARTLQRHLRSETDCVARYGGEEFAVILPRTNPMEAMHVADRIHADVRALKIPHEGSSVSEYLTVSIGVSTIVPEIDDHASLIFETADRALYEAKRSGRNRIVSTSPE
jgi:diguanylate cyclase (GGDEF)-like protein